MRLVVLAIVVVLTGCVSQNSSGNFQGEKFDLQEAAKTRVSLGLTYLKNGKYQQAKQNLDKALSFAPRSADVHYALAYYYQTVEEWERAESSYEDALNLAPRDGDIANSYGAYLCQQKQFDKATVYFNKALANNQYANSAQTYENMGICAEEQGATESAISYFENALNHQPGRSSSLYMLTELYIKTSQWDKASDSLRRYEKVSKVTPDSIQLAIEIAEGKGDEHTAQGYGEMLISLYPHSQAAKAFVAKLRAEKEKHSMVTRVKTRTERTAPKAKPTSPMSPAEDVAQHTPKASEVEEGGQHAPEAPEAPEAKDNVDKSSQTSESQGASSYPTQADASSTKASDEAEKSVSPSAVAEEASTKQASTNSNNDEENSETRYHVVKRGENLYRISLRYNILMARLLEWNSIVDPSEIEVGTQLRLTPPQ
ncbi:type IV pilus biogenesis/stability protein PilW [Alteromonas sp. C1M14]|uniref:type IV pilus biogenesis/stability protein PilW n=1 Tax=Alteromonas sp. C1M14 TaxID=2841567 RepID=UPI001C080842|nr:type IV pilus biogenesis/stability protein PilW [Alteromonas sp. C1M14]MBU2979155.1 type IV pilus biogenesis/stability protein PilW [Alteromonas sp. C1M14]